MMMRYKESPEPPPADKVPANWGAKSCTRVSVSAKTQVLVSDGSPQEGAGFKNFSLTIWTAKEAETDRLFNALANGGQMQMRLGKTFFSPRFGMVTDKFGLRWMVGVFEQSSKQQRSIRATHGHAGAGASINLIETRSRHSNSNTTMPRKERDQWPFV